MQFVIVVQCGVNILSTTACCIISSKKIFISPRSGAKGDLMWWKVFLQEWKWQVIFPYLSLMDI